MATLVSVGFDEISEGVEFLGAVARSVDFDEGERFTNEEDFPSVLLSVQLGFIEAS